MAPSDYEDMPLGALVSRAEDIIKQIDAARDDQTTQSLISDGLACLDRASTMVDSLGLISSNEDKDDIQTSSLRFLFIPHLRATLLAHTSPREPRQRLAAVATAQRFHRYFLLTLQRHGFFTPSSPHYRIVSAALENPNDENDDDERRTSGGGSGTDPATLRQLKVERFKQEKQLQTRLTALQRASKDGNTSGEYEERDGDDREQEEREMWLLKLDLAALKSSEEVRTLSREVEVLKHMATTSQEDRDAAAADMAAQNEALMAQLRKAAAGLSSSNGLSAREQLHAQVFRPSHILPTLTVEQAGEIELAQALERQKLEEAAAAQRAKQEAEARSDDDDEEVYKQRAWDEFKDDNPTGWGNSKLRPCG